MIRDEFDAIEKLRDVRSDLTALEEMALSMLDDNTDVDAKQLYVLLSVILQAQKEAIEEAECFIFWRMV